MILHHILQTLFLLAGAASLMAALLNWDWFFNSENAAPVVRYLGRNGSRWFYGIVGALLIAAAVLFYYQIA